MVNVHSSLRTLVRRSSITNRRSVIVALGSALAATPALARDRVQIVGSSTAYPFLSAAARRFATLGFPEPQVQSTGTDTGMQLLCGGDGDGFPDAASASDEMTQEQFDACAVRGIRDIMQLNFGFDAIVLAGAASGPSYWLTSRSIFLALAREVPVGGRLVENPNRTWSQIDPSLPDVPIRVYGPPLLRGMRRYIEFTLMQLGAREAGHQLAGRDEWIRTALSGGIQTMREDGAWIEYGEDPATLLPRLINEPGALAFMSYQDTVRYRRTLSAAAIDGVAADFSADAASNYPLRRPLFLCAKRSRLTSTPSLPEFIAHLSALETSGPLGYLAAIGLAPLTSTERSRALAIAASPLARPRA